MNPASASLHAALVAAYEPYVRQAMVTRGLATPPAVVDAVQEGRVWLEGALHTLLALPFEAQRRSPLEVFQEALRFPTESIRETGVPPVLRDDAARRALPGDLYDLAPASSRDLGDSAWQAHLGWGVAKAKEVAGVVPAGAASPPEPTPPRPPRRPVVALVGADLMDRSRIEPAVLGAGLALEVWRNPAALEAGLAGPLPVVVLVDLTHPSADTAIREAAGAGIRTYAFGPHVDDIALGRARSLGATDAVARSRFFRTLPDLLPKLA